jgi:ankyrin repeat protein
VIRVLVLGLVTIAGAACAGQGANVDPHKIFNSPGVAELAQAAADGDANRVRQLVAQGVNPDAHGDKDVTPLAWAMLNKSTKGFAALLDAGANPEEPAVNGDPVILMAAMANDPAYLEILLAHHVDPSKRRGRSGRTPLIAAILNGNTGAPFKMLLAAGADPNRTDRMDDSALHIAATSGRYAQVLVLLDAGANPRLVNAQHKTFQAYLHMTPTHLLTPEAKQQLAAIDVWLRTHHVPVENAGPK